MINNKCPFADGIQVIETRRDRLTTHCWAGGVELKQFDCRTVQRRQQAGIIYHHLAYFVKNFDDRYAATASLRIISSVLLTNFPVTASI
jgi:hypothetical protein